MQTKYTYLLVDFFCIVFPFLFSFHPKIKFNKQWNLFFIPCFVTAAFFITWDVFFTRWTVWSFNPKYVLGIYFVNLPIEEVLFFICIPYACVFTYYCLTQLVRFSFLNKSAIIVSLLLIVVLLILGFGNIKKLYTSVTFILLAVFLIFLYIKKVNYLARFFVSFLAILIPFFISNGILTGSFIEEPVVLYNNNYNLGVRMFTIPVEDTFYGMLLLLMNVSGFEFFKARKS